MTRLACHSTTCRCRGPLPRRCDSGIPFAGGRCWAFRVRATPAALVPHQPHRPPQRREVHQLNQLLTIRPQPPATSPTVPTRNLTTDKHPQQQTHLVVNTDHLHIAQPNQQLTHTRRINDHKDPPDSRCGQHRYWRIPPVQARTLTPPTPTSNATSPFTAFFVWLCCHALNSTTTKLAWARSRATLGLKNVGLPAHVTDGGQSTQRTVDAEKIVSRACCAPRCRSR